MSNGNIIMTKKYPGRLLRPAFRGTRNDKVGKVTQIIFEIWFNSISRKFGKRKVTLNGEPRTCERLQKLLLSTAGLTNNNLVLILVLHPDIEF